MIYTVENNYFTLGVKEMGAELTSLKSKKTGTEFIWCGDADVWYGQSPILFPIIGRLLNDKYRLNGVEYTMPKHGLVRKKPFKLVSRTDDSLTFLQSDDEASFQSYPYHFDLFVEFRLLKNGLKVSHRVVNKNDFVMFYSFGAHPAFNCQIGDFLEFPHNQTLRTERIDNESILIDETFPVIDNDKKIIITKDIFSNDALILSGITDKEITLGGENRESSVKFSFDSPVLGIWAKLGAPYVCIEPWWGINDSYHVKNDLSEKREILSLDAKSSKIFTWTAEISE